MPNQSPRWVPRVLQRYATLSPSAKMSSTVAFRSGNAERYVMMVCFKPSVPGGKARRDGIIYVVSSHELLHGSHVALIPGLLMESANQSFVILFDRHRSLLLFLAYSLPLSGRHHEHDATRRSPSH